MKDIWHGILGAIKLIITLDGNIIEIVLLSLFISLSSTLISTAIAIPSAIFFALNEFKFKKTIAKLIHTFMALPPVIAGLIVYIIFSRKGPFGSLGILFTPTVMIIAQMLIVVPIVMGTTINIINTKGKLIIDELNNLNADNLSRYKVVLNELKYNIYSNILLGFSRAISEVGAVMLVGGNIEHKTRVMTTYIVLQTNMGNFDGAIAIGLILLIIAYIVNSLVLKLSRES